MKLAKNQTEQAAPAPTAPAALIAYEIGRDDRAATRQLAPAA